MKFAEPIWLVAGLAAIAGLVFVYRLLDRKQRAALAEFASSHLLAKLTASFSPGRRMVKRGLLVAAAACVFLALARPQWGYHWVDEKQRGIDIFFAIDTSKSMLTQDVNPNRLERAKMAITDFVRKLDGDRVGLIAFAGESFLQAPLTLDYDAFQDSLDAIDVNTIPRGGTDIASAIQEAQAAFANNTQNKKILVLVTDGEDLDGQAVDAARAAQKDGLVIYTVGVGTAAGGLIPVPNADGGTDFVKDPSTGEFVKSHLDEKTLTAIAEATGGMYQPLGQQGEGLGVIYDKALASLPKHDIASKRTRVYEERFQWPLATGLVLLFASMLIGTRRSIAAPVMPPIPARAKRASAAIVLAALTVPTLAHASAQSAESAYKKGDYNKAESQYQDAAANHPDDAAIQYDYGASAYKSGEFDAALPAFQKALGTDDPALQQQAYYNIGNTQYRIGQKTEQASPQDTIKQWQSAVQAYDAALKLKPDDADAKYNREFVEKKLEKLQKQQQQQQQQNKQDQKQQNQQQQNQQQQNQNQQQQNQQNQQNQQQQNQQQQNQQQQGSQGSPNNQPQQNQNGQNQAQSGGQPKDQNGQQQQQQAGGNPDQKKDQGGQQQQQQTAGNPNQDQKKDQSGQQQQQQTAGAQPKDQNQQQKGNGGDQQKQQQTAQNGQKGGAAGQAGADKDKSNADQADAALPAGELTPEQAKDLLNSLKGEEHILPVAADTRSAHPKDDQVLKDW